MAHRSGLHIPSLKAQGSTSPCSAGSPASQHTKRLWAPCSRLLHKALPQVLKHQGNLRPNTKKAPGPHCSAGVRRYQLCSLKSAALLSTWKSAPLHKQAQGPLALLLHRHLKICYSAPGNLGPRASASGPQAPSFDTLWVPGGLLPQGAQRPSTHHHTHLQESPLSPIKEQEPQLLYWAIICYSAGIRRPASL
jgi:hypothetical protein